MSSVISKCLHDVIKNKPVLFLFGGHAAASANSVSLAVSSLQRVLVLLVVRVVVLRSARFDHVGANVPVFILMIST